MFTRTLALELETDLGRVGRFGDGVLVGPISMGIGLDLDLVVVLGLAEGTFPAPVHDDSLLPDHEREAAGDELPLRRARVDREHRELLAGLAGARHVLGVPRGDLRRSTERVPSRWVLDIASALAGERWWTDDLLHAHVDWVEHVASFDAGPAHASLPGHRAGAPPPHAARRPPERRRRARGHHRRRCSPRRDVVAARRSDGVHPLRRQPRRARRAVARRRHMSATRLQTWAACPFAYFVENILRVEPVENPEDALQISPLDKGSLVHEALEEFIVEVLDRPAADQPGPDDGGRPTTGTRMAAIGADLCAEFEARGSPGARSSGAAIGERSSPTSIASSPKTI